MCDKVSAREDQRDSRPEDSTGNWQTIKLHTMYTYAVFAEYIGSAKSFIFENTVSNLINYNARVRRLQQKIILHTHYYILL